MRDEGGNDKVKETLTLASPCALFVFDKLFIFYSHLSVYMWSIVEVLCKYVVLTCIE